MSTSRIRSLRDKKVRPQELTSLEWSLRAFAVYRCNTSLHGACLKKFSRKETSGALINPWSSCSRWSIVISCLKYSASPVNILKTARVWIVPTVRLDYSWWQLTTVKISKRSYGIWPSVAPRLHKVDRRVFDSLQRCTLRFRRMHKPSQSFSNVATCASLWH